MSIFVTDRARNETVDFEIIEVHSLTEPEPQSGVGSATSCHVSIARCGTTRPVWTFRIEFPPTRINHLPLATSSPNERGCEADCLRELQTYFLRGGELGEADGPALIIVVHDDDYSQRPIRRYSGML